MKQKKSTIKPPYDPKPYEVTKVENTRITAVRDGKVRVRNQGKVKLLKERSKNLGPSKKEEEGVVGASLRHGEAKKGASCHSSQARPTRPGQPAA